MLFLICYKGVFGLLGYLEKSGFCKMVFRILICNIIIENIKREG